MKISVIVPALDEEKNVGDAVRAAALADEILVVDGGSKDATRREAEGAGARVLSAPRGLARQCNDGAMAATGDVFLFQAADSRLTPGWREELEDAVRRRYVVWGGFHLRLDDPGFLFKIWSMGGNVRARLDRVAFADQGLFVRREAFEKVGGFREDASIPFARLCWDLRPHGEYRLLATRMISSARKWHEHGRFRTTWHHVRTYRRFRRELPPFR